MKITKHNDFYLFKNDNGEYHLSLSDYDRLGEKDATELAESEINKKLSSNRYTNLSITFKQARMLGFCEYGIKDFCKRLNLDINCEYEIEFLKSKLDIETYIEYSEECQKLFGKDVLLTLGNPSDVLNSNRKRIVLNCYIRSGIISDHVLRELAYNSCLRVINNFEKLYPHDDRPRLAMEAGINFQKGLIDDVARSAAESAARSAAYSVAKSAAESAYSAAIVSAESAAESAYSAAIVSAYSAAIVSAESAYSAAIVSAKSAAIVSTESAAYSAAIVSAESAAESAVWWVVWSAAYSAELNFQIDTLIKLLNETN